MFPAQHTCRNDLIKAVQSLQSGVDFARLQKAEPNSPEWHRIRDRRDIVTASRLAAATGYSEYESRYRHLQERRYNVKKDFTNNTHVQRGVRLEPAILSLLRRVLRQLCTGWEVIGAVGLFVREPFAATPDGFVCSGSGKIFPLEVKSRSRADSLDGIPLHYALQVLAQVYCTGAAGGFYFSVTADSGWRLMFLRFTPEVAEWLRDHLRNRTRWFIDALAGNAQMPERQSKKKEECREANELLQRNTFVLAHSEAETFQFLAAQRYILCLQ